MYNSNGDMINCYCLQPVLKLYYSTIRSLSLWVIIGRLQVTHIIPIYNSNYIMLKRFKNICILFIKIVIIINF